MLSSSVPGQPSEPCAPSEAPCRQSTGSPPLHTWAKLPGVSSPSPLPGVAPSPPPGSASQMHLCPSCKPGRPPCISESRRKVVFSSDLCLQDTGLSPPGISGESQLLPARRNGIGYCTTNRDVSKKSPEGVLGFRGREGTNCRSCLTRIKKNILVLRKIRQVHEGHCTHCPSIFQVVLTLLPCPSPTQGVL